MKNLELEASLKRSSCKYIKMFRFSPDRSNISSVYWRTATLLKLWFTTDFFSQNIFNTATLLACNFTKISSIKDVFLRTFQTFAINYFNQSIRNFFTCGRTKFHVRVHESQA